ncbi:MAG: M56 family metallopeptidase [Planctomycetota bacterium]
MAPITNLLLSNGVTASVFFIIALLLAPALRDPRTRHILWLLILANLVSPMHPVFSVSKLIQSEASEITARNAPISKTITETNYPGGLPAEEKKLDTPTAHLLTSPLNSVDDNDLSLETLFIPQRKLLRAAMLTWLIGSCLWLGFSFKNICQFQLLLRGTLPASSSQISRVYRIGQKLRIPQLPDVRLSQANITPMVWSLWQPTLVLPIGLLEDLSDEEFDTLIAHELAHVRRRDYLIRWLECLATIIHWWNPVVWLARKHLRNAEEECCDAWVQTILPQSKKAYVSALLTTTQFLSQEPNTSLSFTTGFGGNYNMKRRVQMFLSSSPLRPISMPARIGIKLVLLVGICVNIKHVEGDTSIPVAAATRDQGVKSLEKPDEVSRSKLGYAEEKGFRHRQSNSVPNAKVYRVSDVSISCDGLFLATCGSDRTVRFWDRLTGKERWKANMLAGERYVAVNSVALSPDGRHLAAGGNELCVFDTRNGALMSKVNSSSGFHSLSFTANGKHLVFACNGDASVRVWPMKLDKQSRCFKLPKQASNVAISPDGKTVAAEVNGRYAGTSVVYVWDVATGRELQRLRPLKSSVHTLAFSPDGSTLAVGGRSSLQSYRVTDNADISSRDLGDSLVLWSVESGKQLQRFPVVPTPSLDTYAYQKPSGEKVTVTRGKSRSVDCIAFLGGGQVLVTGEDDGTIRLYEVASGLQIGCVADQPGGVKSIALADHDRVMALIRGDFAATILMPEEEQ